MFGFQKSKKEFSFAEIKKGNLSCEKCNKSFSIKNMPPFTLAKCPHCSEYNFIPCTIRNYCIFKPLGGGGSGSVYKAYDIELSRYVAIKTLCASSISGSAETALGVFLKEYAIGKKMHEHQNICKTYDMFEWNAGYYMVLEFVDGFRLDKLVQPEHLPSPKDVIFWAKQILSALQHLYNLGYLYRDIKPQNIIIASVGNLLKIIDFGLSCKVDEANEKRNVIEGSPEFNIAPERVTFSGEDMRSEIYGLGMLMYYCLTGNTFYKANTVKELISLHHAPFRVSDLSKKLTNVPTDLAIAVGKMIKKEPELRYQSYKEAYIALESIAI
ncbi:MAG: serine/threonine-protein kinase [Lentisphaerota bacterium]